MRVINLNATKLSNQLKEDFNPLQKLEVPIDLAPGVQTFKESKNQDADMVLDGNNHALSCHKAEFGMKNSNCMINYSYCPEGSQSEAVKLIACLQGPIEPRFASKQLPNKCFLEVNLKGFDKAQQNSKQG